MRYSSVIFDFDGTICDTGEGIKKSAKYALDAYGVKSEEWQELDYFIGPPLLVTFQEKFDKTVAEADELVKKFRERYKTIGLYESALYDDIAELLMALKNDGIKIGIASSKPLDFVEELLCRFGIRDLFDSVCAVSFNADCEAKQNIISRCLDELGDSKEDAIVVGDRFYDIEGARANGIASVGVLWGYGTRFEFIESGADFIAEKKQDIESIALGLYERTESVNGIFSGKILTIHHDDVTLCDGTETKRECVDHPGGVGIIAVNADDEVYLVRQFRYPYKETIFEIPAGKLDKGELPIEAGKRELKEECGLVAEDYISLGEVYPSPGYTSEVIRIFAAENFHQTEQSLDEGEFLDVCKVKFDKFIDMIMSGEIKDAKTIAAGLKYKEMRNK